MLKYIIGVDPGKKGGLCTYDIQYNKIHCRSIPLIGNEFDFPRFADYFYMHIQENTHVFIEQVHAIFGSAAGATFNFGFVCGAIQGIVSAKNLPFTLVQPKAWQKVMFQGIPEIRKPPIKIKTGKRAGTSIKGRLDTKAMSLLAAKRLFPTVNLLATERSKKPHDGIVDALLIAEYGRRSLCAEPIANT